MFPRKVHHTVFLISTALLVIGMPVSNFLLSCAIILLSVNWLLEGRFREKWTIFRSRPSIFLIVSIYLLHLIWFFNTTDLTYAIHDIRIKLPLLALPLIYGTSTTVTEKQFRYILQLFTGVVLVSSFITTYILLGFSDLDPVDSRYASLFISHIRFSLIVVLSFYCLFYLTFFKGAELKLWKKTGYVLIMIWFIGFLILLQSFTGIVIFVILLPLALVWFAYHKKKKTWIVASFIMSFLLIVLILLYGILCYHRYTIKYDTPNEILETSSINGNPYIHHPELDDYENGFKIWIYICEKELRQGWNTLSEYKYDGCDRKGQPIRSTLIRYMTSQGLRKDSLGLLKLTAEDIQMIEKGYTNCLYKNKFSLYPRIYELLWEMEKYRKTGNPTGQSLGQRLEYLKIGLHIIKHHFWFGTGTGDVEKEFARQYEEDHSLLRVDLRHRTHNQLVTFFITFGVFGFLWFLLALFIPPLLEKKYRHFLFTFFFLIGLLSMFNEDTLETHVGVSFFAFFYSFFLFSIPHTNASDSSKDQ
jgi:hypothetical protein